MILKVPDGNGAFTLYGEVDLISYCHDVPDVLREGTIDHTEGYRGNVMEYSPKYFISFMNKNQLAETDIISYGPVYIMNDNGRTVETLN